MQIPVIRGVIDRRILVNYRVDAAVLARLLPAPFRPKLVNGAGMAGVCLIRLRDIRPRFLPRWLGYLAVLSAVAGLMLLVTGYLMPAYTDSVAAERIRSGAECKRGVPNTNEDRQCETDPGRRDESDPPLYTKTR